MPGIARVGQDLAGGFILGPGSPRVIVDGSPASVIGDAVAGHGPTPHSGAVMIVGSFRVTAGGIPLCRRGDTASCGDAASPGSSRSSAG